MGATAPEQWVRRYTKGIKTKAPKKKAAAAPAKAKPKASTPNSSSSSSSSSKPKKEGLEGTKTASDYYFFKSTSQEEAKKYQPKKLDQVARPVEQPKLAVGQSAWNKAGTWEEQNHSKWARGRVQELLDSITLPEGTGATLESWTVKGDATVTFSRGKRRAGFDLHVSTKWKVSQRFSAQNILLNIEFVS